MDTGDSRLEVGHLETVAVSCLSGGQGGFCWAVRHPSVTVVANQSHTMKEAATKTCQQLQETLLVSLVSSSQTLLKQVPVKTGNIHTSCQPPESSIPCNARGGGHQHQAPLFLRPQVSRAGEYLPGGAGLEGPRELCLLVLCGS